MGPESASTPVAVLAVGGIDPTGGAGLTVDIGFLTHLGARVGTVVTALTVQDDDAVTRVEPVADDLFEQQLDAAARTLSPLVGAVKT
ncbi:MAG: hydroxymethylpyrimidine/phosphomethylpyrimidine kinase, partial [Acidobacteriota bacterium]|nr:hydroxymethylpyrimidine/phosphomethylpyrimidine kinase [Acidobacteriota bacterium]